MSTLAAPARNAARAIGLDPNAAKIKHIVKGTTFGILIVFFIKAIIENYGCVVLFQ